MTVRTDDRSLQDALDDLPDLFECFYNDSPALIRVPDPARSRFRRSSRTGGTSRYLARISGEYAR